MVGCIFVSSTAFAEGNFYFEIGVGKNGINNPDWLGNDSTGCMFGGGYEYTYAQRHVLSVSYRHASQCTRGEGFDDRLESYNDSVGVYYKIKF